MTVLQTGEGEMTTAASCEPGTLARSDVLACIPHLRAFAAVLTGDRSRADDLVHDTIEQIVTAANRPRAGANLKVQMFATLHRLHYGAQRPSTEGSAQQRKSPPTQEAGLEPDELFHVLGCLCDEQREALILTAASGLSYQQAAEVCGCQIAAIESRVSRAWRELSRALEDRP
jgi:RNA polymerase sigma-70 factor (ECF subfamily)